MSVNKQIVLASRPEGTPSKENFEFVEASLPEPEAGQVLVRTLYLSVDPYMRGRMKDTKSYAPPYALNEVIKGGAIGQVVESSEPNLRKGDLVTGMWGWQQYAAVNTTDLSLIDSDEAPITAYLGALGLTGLTAYFGMEDIGKPKDGETVVVSGAAGAVGMIAGQIGKIVGARVVGIAGSDDKCAYLRDKLGFDVVLNYKAEQDMSAAIKGPLTGSTYILTMLAAIFRMPYCVISTGMHVFRCADRSRLIIWKSRISACVHKRCC